MRNLVLTVIGGSVLFAFASRDEPAPAVSIPAPGEVTLVAASPAPAPSPSSAPLNGATTSIPRSPDGHFYVEAQVNGSTQRFLVDTGASAVAFSRADARRAGLHFDESAFTGTADTAGGQIRVAPVTVDRMRIGSHEIRDVRAVVVDSALPVPLLGQTFLSQIAEVSVRDDRMTMR